MPLVLTRRIGERLFIGDSIAIEVVEGGKQQIKLAVSAPDGVHVVREELVEVQDPLDPRLQIRRAKLRP